MIKVSTESGTDEWPGNEFIVTSDGALDILRHENTIAAYAPMYWTKVWDDRAVRIRQSVITSSHSLKIIREAIAYGQSAMVNLDLGVRDEGKMYAEILDDLVENIDRQRPLGKDGKHGDLHTAYCQCEDVAPPSTDG